MLTMCRIRLGVLCTRTLRLNWVWHACVKHIQLAQNCLSWIHRNHPYETSYWGIARQTHGVVCIYLRKRQQQKDEEQGEGVERDEATPCSCFLSSPQRGSC